MMRGTLNQLSGEWARALLVRHSAVLPRCAVGLNQRAGPLQGGEFCLEVTLHLCALSSR